METTPEENVADSEENVTDEPQPIVVGSADYGAWQKELEEIEAANQGDPLAEEPALQPGYRDEETPDHKHHQDETAEVAVEEQTNEAESEDDNEDEDAVEVEDWSEFTVDELREELHNRGLTVGGTKAELVGRLVEDDAKQTE